MPTVMFTELKILKIYMELEETQNAKAILSKKEQSIIVLDYKLHYKAIAIAIQQ